MDRAFGMYGGVQNKQVLIDTKETPLGKPRHRCEHFSDDLKLWKILTQEIQFLKYIAMWSLFVIITSSV